MATSQLHIVPDELVARSGELTDLLHDNGALDALRRVIRADLALSSGSTKDNGIELIESLCDIYDTVDDMIKSTIRLFNNAEEYFVATDKRLAEEIGK